VVGGVRNFSKSQSLYRGRGVVVIVPKSGKMKKYGGSIKEYMENMKEYIENMTKYEGNVKK